jgi:hypothetical protein
MPCFTVLGFALPLLLAEMKRMGSDQPERRKCDTENCDAAGGPSQEKRAGDDGGRAEDDSNLKGR